VTNLTHRSWRCIWAVMATPRAESVYSLLSLVRIGIREAIVLGVSALGLASK
jgi:hypothetical protein